MAILMYDNTSLIMPYHYYHYDFDGDYDTGIVGCVASTGMGYMMRFYPKQVSPQKTAGSSIEESSIFIHIDADLGLRCLDVMDFLGFFQGISWEDHEDSMGYETFLNVGDIFFEDENGFVQRHENLQKGEDYDDLPGAI